LHKHSLVGSRCTDRLDSEPIYEASSKSRASSSSATRQSLSDDLLPWILGGSPSAVDGTAPGKESLNVAVAAAVVCSEFRRRGRPGASHG
jgi:hypothetical protein